MAYEDRVLDALGDPTRRLVFKRLRRGACSVGEIAERMDVSRPAVSQHLAVLKQAGLVVARTEGYAEAVCSGRQGDRETAQLARWILG
jgi:DNA-binding transcriptional ArsR family regulator